VRENEEATSKLAAREVRVDFEGSFIGIGGGLHGSSNLGHLK